MNWTQFLKDEIETTYNTTGKLLEKVEPSALGWKPQTGNNWMTTGQLLYHISEGCGSGFRGFVTGDWGLPEGIKLEDLTPEQMLPPAEKLPTIESVDAARQRLCADQNVALEILNGLTEDELENRRLAAPWAPGVELPLGRQLYQMVQHLDRHKAQLFYYLKLQGCRVNTADLWG